MRKTDTARNREKKRVTQKRDIDRERESLCVCM